MRKLIIPAVLALLTYPSLVHAQLLKSYGVKLAYTSSTQTLNHPFATLGWWTSSKTSSEPGIDVAAFAEWLNLPVLSVVTQVEYDQRGARLDYYEQTSAGPRGPVSTDGRLDYISVPIMAKFTLLKGSVSPYLIAGPRADFLVGYQDFQIRPGITPIYSEFRKAMLGWSMGAGLETGSILPVDLDAEIRYDFDFLNSYNNDGVALRNNAFDLWVGVAL